MKTKCILLSITLIIPLLLPAQGKGKAGVHKVVQQLKEDSIFQDAVVGLMVMDPSGNELTSWNPDMPLLTASTMKTITTGLTLIALGPDYRYSTRIAYSGEVFRGSLYGDLYIVGGGDPTFGSIDSIATSIDTIFAYWTQALQKCGIFHINGSIVADDRFFTHEVMPESWAWGNLNASYGAGPSGLSFYENNFKATLVPGLREGEKVSIRNEYPFFPGMQFDNRLQTGPPKGRSRTSAQSSDLKPLIRLSGSIPAGTDSIIIYSSNKYPSLSCAWQLDQYLNRNGVRTSQSIRMIDLENDPHSESLTPISSWESPRLIDVIWVTNHISNNFFAETLLKTLAKERTGVGSYDSAYVAVSRMLTELDIPQRGFTMEDGSGLSRQNYVSARFFCTFYNKLKGNAIFAEYLSTFPVPGGFGTLQSVIAKAPNKERLHAKSGTLANVRCYAGYVDASDGIYTFAIMVNNYGAATVRVQQGVERFLQALTEL